MSRRRTRELVRGGLILEAAREKAGISRFEMYSAYMALCEELGWEPRSDFTVTKWCQGTHDPPSTDFLLLATVLNRGLSRVDRLPDLDGLPDLTKYLTSLRRRRRKQKLPRL